MNKIEGTKINKTLWLSFIVPVYNGEKYLKDCLDSLLCQNVSYDEYEIICINDGSKDNSSHILDEYANKYQNVKVIHKENEGVSIARNIGIDLAKGKYIWFVDCDDVIRANCLGKLFNLMTEYKPEVFRLNYDRVDSNFKCSFNQDESLQFERVEECQNSALCWVLIISSNLIKNNGLYFDKNFSIGEDTLFCQYLYAYQKGDAINILDKMYFYRQHANSAMHGTSIKARDKHVLDLIERGIHIKNNVLELVKTNKQKTKVLLENAYFSISSAKLKLPESSLDYKEVARKIKEAGLNNTPFFHSGLKRKEGLKAFCRELARSFFRFEWIYKIYFKIRRKRFNKRNKQ